LINILSRPDSIDHNPFAFQLKQHPVIADAQAVLVLTALEFLQVATEILLQEVQPKADLMANVVWQSA